MQVLITAPRTPLLFSQVSEAMRSFPADWLGPPELCPPTHRPSPPPCLGGRRLELHRAEESVRGALRAVAAGAASGSVLGVLITGARGVGKSALAEALLHRCASVSSGSSGSSGSSTGRSGSSTRAPVSSMHGLPVFRAVLPATILAEPGAKPAALLARLQVR